jgi:isopenicillin N synthase-like dioxygenase
MSLPVVDMHGLEQGDPAAIRRVAAELRAAGLANGFFYLVGHGIPDDELEGVFDWSRRLFALDTSLKQAVAGERQGDRGYAVMGHGAAIKEEFYLTRERPGVANRWPQGLPGFPEAMMRHLEKMHAVSEQLMRAFALSLDLPEDHFDDFCADPIAALRLVRYLPGSPGAGPHSDYGSLTLLLQDGRGGLEVLDHASGDWIAAPPVQGAFVVNVGDLFARWTNGRYRSSLHRVINPGGTDRYSVPFFLTGAAAHPIVCLPSCLEPGESPLYPPTTVEEHLRARFAQQGT